MNASAEATGQRFDSLKWLLVIALLVGGAVANGYFAGQVQFIYRLLAMLAVFGVALAIAFYTTKGQAFWNLAREAQVEVRKVVWPSNAETNQTTMLVMVVVLITGLMLWLFDLIIGQVAKLIIG